MTSADKKEFREIIQDCTGTLNVKIDLSLQQQKEFQDAVLQRLDKFNGRVYNLEKITGERSAVIQEFHDFKTEITPKVNKIESLEQEKIENGVTKKFVLKAVGFGMAAPAMIWAIIQIISKFM